MLETRSLKFDYFLLVVSLGFLAFQCFLQNRSLLGPILFNLGITLFLLGKIGYRQFAQR